MFRRRGVSFTSTTLYTTVRGSIFSFFDLYIKDGGLSEGFIAKYHPLQVDFYPAKSKISSFVG